MRRLVHTVALGAALVALATGVWRDYGAFTALKRAGMAYLVAYFLAGGLGIAARAAVVAIRDPEPEPEPEPTRGRSRRRKGRAPTPPAAEDAPPADSAETANDAAAPAPVETS